MSVAAIGLLVFGAGIAVHLEEIRGAKPEESTQVVNLLQRSLELRTGEKRIVQANVDAVACPIARKCTEAIRKSVRADEVLFVRMIGTPEKLRVIADRADAPGHDGVQVQVDLTRGADGWDSQLDLLAAGLFPSERVLVPVHVAPDDDPRPAAVSTQPAITPPRSPVPWVVLGGSLIAGGLAVVLGVQNGDAQAIAETTQHQAEYIAADERAFRTGLGANILFTAAAAGIATSVYLLLAE